MDLLLKRGLPVRQQTATQVPAVSMPTESGLGQPQAGPPRGNQEVNALGNQVGSFIRTRPFGDTLCPARTIARAGAAVRHAGREPQARAAGRPYRSRHRSETDQQIPLDVNLIDEFGHDGEAARLLSCRQAGDPGAGLLPLPDAVHADSERCRGRAEGGEPGPRQGFRSRGGELRSQGYAGDRLRQESDVPQALRPGGHVQRLALSDGLGSQRQSN